MADRTGQQLGHYRLVRLLGQGGFAEVYLGEHMHLGTQAAIKLLHTQLAGEDMEAFRQEARTIARLLHPHIVRVFDFGIEGETPFLVMDYAPNGTVRKRHAKGVALPLPTILGYVKQVADALQYAHDERFIHRDLKPENLLVGGRQEILLSDFGIALIAQTSRSQSMQDVAGTASYMAPEQFQGKPRAASDQYALAVMIYEWLTGACPFHGSFTEIASQHLFVPPPPLQGRMSSISPVVEQVVMTALAKDPHHRFGSVQAFANALEQASQVLPTATISTDRSAAPPDGVTVLSQSSIPTGIDTRPSESFIPTELITPPGSSSTPPERSTPPSQVSLPPKALVASASQAAALPSEVAPASQPSTAMPLPGLPQRGIRRRALVIGLAGVVAGGVAGSGLTLLSHRGTSTNIQLTTSNNPARSNLKFYIITHGPASDPFWSVVNKGVAQAAQDMGIQASYEAPPTFDVVAMAHLIDAAVATHPDGLVVSIPDPAGLGTSIKAAVAAGIPVISINSGSDVAKSLGVLVHIGQTEEQAGIGGGQKMGAAGVKHALCVNQEVGNAALELRCKGFAEGLAQTGGTVTEIGVNLSNQTQTQQTIVAALQHDPTIDGILTLGPTVASPAIKALQDLNKLGQIKLATFDLSSDVLQAIKNGQILFAIDQQQYLQGYLPIVLLTLYKTNLNTIANDIIQTGPGFVDSSNLSQVIQLTAQGTR